MYIDNYGRIMPGDPNELYHHGVKGMHWGERNGNYVVMGNAMMWLYDCSSFGSPYDLIADTGYIYTTKTYPRESTVSSGVINRIS